MKHGPKPAAAVEAADSIAVAAVDLAAAAVAAAVVEIGAAADMAEAVAVEAADADATNFSQKIKRRRLKACVFFVFQIL